jgi:hypothetical protein
VCGVDCTKAACPHRESFVADAPIDEAVAAALDLIRQCGPLRSSTNAAARELAAV